MTTAQRLTAALADRYRLERELGAGGMATVYLAEDLKHRRQVAVKVLRPDLAATMGAERFEREIHVAARLQHPHILGVLDSGEAAGFFYYVMPYVEGESLRDRLTRSGELPVGDALRLLGEVAEALAVAHKAGVVHRDIKPENILLSGRHALVMDFGVAKAVSEASGRQQLTTAGVALGTPAYMAPEQATADPQMDGRVDIYALGVLAYEMLTGHPPFHGLNPQQTLAAHVTQAPIAVGQRRAGLSPALESVVMRCLAKRPADRFQTADDLVAALEPLATPSGGMTPTHTQPTSAAAPARPRSRRRVATLAGAVLLAAGVALIGWATFGRSATRTLSIATTTPVTNDPGLEIDPALSPDGTLIAYAAGPSGATRIFVRQVDGGRPVAIGDSLEVGQRAPKWSPDGGRLLFLAGRKVMVGPALGGQTRAVVQQEGWISGADWSPDGREIAFAVGDTLRIARADDGASRTLAGARDLHSIAWSPDGTMIAAVSGNASFVADLVYGNSAVSAIVVFPVRGGSPVPVTGTSFLSASPAWLPDSRSLLFVSDRGGSRDVYSVDVSRGGPRGDPRRVTTGLRPHSITVSGDGRRMGYNLFTSTANIWSLPISSTGPLPASSATPITRGNQVIESVALSADGQWLYFDSDRSGRAEIYRIPATGGEPSQLTDAAGGNYMPAPSPDGREVAFQSQRNGTRDVFVMPAEGGAAEPVRVGPGDENVPFWSPDGKRLGFYAGEGDLGTGARGAYGVERTGTGWSDPKPWPDGLYLTPDGRARLAGNADSTVAQAVDGGGATFRWFRRSPSDPTVRRAPQLAPDGRRLFFQGIVGTTIPRFGLWEVSPDRDAAREVVRFDDPYRLPLWGAFATDGTRLYFTLDERQSDVWVADLHAQ
ncbi:MAG TPA: protein kinase [Gemmatimonadales bacterium]|nr:protein kinase [Gemmatimonadales bacterium]